MTIDELKAQIALGEDSRRQFKQDISNPDALAAETAALSNSQGGVILLGVAELRRLFQSVDLLHADEVPIKVGIEAIDHRSLGSFFA